MNIIYKHYPPTLAVTVRQTVQKRAEIQARLADLAQKIPAEQIAGPPFCIFNFITSVQEGLDVTMGYPVTGEIKGVETERLPEMGTLATVHRGGPETLGQTVGQVFAYANRYAIISDEFYRQVYMDDDHPEEPGIEVHFIIHNWNKKLAASLERVLGAEARERVMQGNEQLGIESGVDERFQWVKGMLARLDGVADQHQKWDILSSCAHVFPRGQVDKLAAVFSEVKTRTGDPLQAVDAVIAFMDADPGWVEGSLREGHTIYAAKKPRDPKAYAAAKTDLERRQAYCFCPLVRTKMDQGMPVDFCNCGSGWFRQQWEGAIGQAVRVATLKSVLQGDEKCEFAIHLPEDL